MIFNDKIILGKIVSGSQRVEKVISTVAKGAKTITQFGAKALKFYDNPLTQMAITAYQTNGDPMSIAMAGAGLTGSLTGKMRNSQKLAGLITKAPKTVQKFANATGKAYDKVSGLGTKLNNKINAMAEKSQNAISNFFGKTKNKLGDKLSDFGMKARSFGLKHAEVPRLAMPGGGSIGRPVKVPVGVGINQTKLDNLRQIKANKAVNLNARSVANKVDDVAEDLARSASRNKSSQLNHTASEAGNHQGAGRPGQTHKELENDLNRKKVAGVDTQKSQKSTSSQSSSVKQTQSELEYELHRTSAQPKEKPILQDGSHLKRTKRGRVTGLEPNVKYVTGEFDNYILGETDELGRISKVTCDDLRISETERARHNSKTPGKQDGDHAGHLIADRFGGSPELDNLVSQLGSVNNGAYKKMEEEWAHLIKSEKKVSVSISPIYEGQSLRPSKIEVEYVVDGILKKKTFYN